MTGKLFSRVLSSPTTTKATGRGNVHEASGYATGFAAGYASSEEYGKEDEPTGRADCGAVPRWGIHKALDEIGWFTK